jgi:hypothetical protein
MIRLESTQTCHDGQTTISAALRTRSLLSGLRYQNAGRFATLWHRYRTFIGNASSPFLNQLQPLLTACICTINKHGSRAGSSARISTTLYRPHQHLQATRARLDPLWICAESSAQVYSMLEPVTMKRPTRSCEFHSNSTIIFSTRMTGHSQRLSGNALWISTSHSATGS